MFSWLRRQIILFLCLLAIGLYRGWFSFGTPSRDAETNKVNINVSVDAGKMETDAEKAKQKIVEKIAQRTKVDQAKGQSVK